jgi:hypothetical protein
MVDNSMTQFPSDPGLLARQLNGRLAESMYANGGAFAQVRPYTDPLQQTVATLLSFASQSRQVEGVVMDSTLLAHCYKVHVEKGRAPVLAYLGSQSPFGVTGGRSINTLSPGTRVLVNLHEGSSYGTIICTLPLRTTSAHRGLSDQITSASRTRVDEGHKRPLKMVGNSKIVDWSAGRPFDGIGAGEVGYISATGIRMTLDDFMLAVAVNEYCGLWAFYHDSLCRLVGYNLQIWSSNYEHESFEDEGECLDLEHFAIYPWEAKGVFNPYDDPRTELSPEVTQGGAPWYSKYEPKSDRQQPFHRVKHIRGYLGQGGRSTVIAPPPLSPPEVWQYKPGDTGEPLSAYTTNKTSSGNPKQDPAYQEMAPVGLHADTCGLGGSRTIQVAKRFTVTKRLLIPDATRRKRPDSGDGDTQKNYRASGESGSGPEHKITDSIKTTGDKPQLQRAAAVLDMHAYLCNYSGLHPFHYHELDYKTWEEQELTYAGADQLPPSFSNLKGSMYLDAPTPKKINIDHRLGAQDFYENESYITLLEDGGISIGDGFGAEIRLTGGSATISAPGDVWLKSGRNVQLWAGRDLIGRAKDNVDLSATEKTVRLKAEKDVMIVAGNGNEGGILLDCRATSPIYDFTQIGDDVKFGGIVMRAPHSEVVMLAQQIYGRTAEIDGGSAGDITFDANKGKRNIVNVCANAYTFVASGVYHFFGQDGEIEEANEFTKDFALICAPTGVNGSIYVVGSILNKGWIYTAEGHIATEFAEQYNYFVLPLQEPGLSDVKEALSQIESLAENDLPAIGQDTYDYNPKELWYAEQRPGNDRIIDTIEFSFRTVPQYKSEDFALFEDRWQQMSRLSGQSVDAWTEKPVKTQVDPETYPYPGKEKYQGSVYFEQDLELYKMDGEGFRSLQRATKHEPLATEPKYLDPTYATPVAKVLNGNYPIIG